MNLTQIWEYYVKKDKIPRTIKRARRISNYGRGHSARVKRLLANKFCNCVKKLEKKYGPRGIGICTASVFNKKGLRRTGQFTCKPNRVTFTRAKTQKRQK